VSHYKSKVAEIIGDYDGMNSKAHITVQNIAKKNPLEVEVALQTIKKKMSELPCISIGVNGFNYFQHGETMTIYAAIKGTYQIDNWFHALKKCFGKCTLTVPHITVARSLSIDKFLKLWPKFRQLTYQDTFSADKVLVFEKNTIEDGKGYALIDIIYFKNEQNAVRSA
jgi:2'-5' RNA ligase